MTTTTIQRELSAADISISLAEVYEAMGGAGEPDADLDREVVQMIEELRSVLVPRFAFCIVDGAADTAAERLTLTTERPTTTAKQPTTTVEQPKPSAEERPMPHAETFTVGRIIATQLRRAQRFAIFVATAGAEFEAWQQRVAAGGDMLRTFIADCLGTIIAEKAADIMESCLQEAIDAEGWRRTNRYSPGYCGWHVSEQQKLFSLFPDANPCGIRLTESSLMLPIKSVSGVVGLGPDVVRRDYTCGLCSYADCFRRKHRK
jgi:hypothetical protein